MISVSFSASFKRAYKRKITGIPDREKNFRSRLAMFINDPFDQRLRTHKLSGKLGELWSFSVEYDIRVVFYFDNDSRAVFVDIGTHDEVY